MTSRDERASYYDLELPDGTRTEVWSVLRSVLSPEESLGYAKACILTRIMRDGKKLDVDRLREAEKVSVEAGMLREAMETYLGSVDAVANRECERFIAELERERDSLVKISMSTAREADALRQILDTERQAAVATAEELVRVRKKLEKAEEWRRTWRNSCNNAREETYRLRCELAALRSTLAAIDKSIGAELDWRDGETTEAAVARFVAELVTLQNRYRPRRQEKEPAPRAPVLAWNPVVEEWFPSYGSTLQGHVTWTHQPPAPGEGE